MDRYTFQIIIEDKAKFYSRYLWNREYNGKIVINNRLKRAYARYDEIDNIIEFNKDLLNVKGLFIDEVLIHELCHWYCKLIGVNNDDGAYEFESEIYASGSRSTEKVIIEKDGNLLVSNEASWFYCEDCDNVEKKYKIDKCERINCYGKDKEKARPKCPICGKTLKYSCEVENMEKWIDYYPREALVKIHSAYLNA